MPQSDARYNCGQQFPLCRFTRMSFLPLFFSGVAITVDNSFLFAVLLECRSCPCSSAALFCLLSEREVIAKSYPIQTVIQLSSANKKADTQKHQKSAGASLSLQNDVLCIGFIIQRRDCLFIRSLADSTKKHRVRTTVFSLSTPKALGGLHRISNLNIFYSVVILI